MALQQVGLSTVNRNDFFRVELVTWSVTHF